MIILDKIQEMRAKLIGETSLKETIINQVTYGTDIDRTFRELNVINK
jgi:hypothetical protein